MKKITLLMSASKRDSALRKLRKAGVLHVKSIQTPQSEDIDLLTRDIHNLENVLKILIHEGPNRDAKSDEVSSIVDEVLLLARKKEHLQRSLEEKMEIKKWFDRWGSVSLKSIQELASAGIYVRYYITDKQSLKRIPREMNIQILKEKQGTIYLVCFAETPDDRLDLIEEKMPEIEFLELKSQIDRLEKEIRKIDKTLEDLSQYKKALVTYSHDLKKRLEFNTVLHGMGEEEHFVYLQGFCPVHRVDDLKEISDKNGWAYIIDNPENPMEVPTLIENPRWLRIVDPLFKFMGTLPGYDEYDISFWFLIFFSLFFGMLIGDGGYGIVFLLITLFVSKRAGKKIPKEPFRLIYLLSIATIIWGAITGNWFGYSKFAQLPFLNRVVVEKVDSFATDNTLFMMYICFVIGIIHLSIAHCIRAFKMINSPKALGEIGWISILWALFFVAGSLVIGKPMPSFVNILLIAGVGLALVFTHFQKNILKGIGTTLGDLPLSIVSSFSDIVSYLRLFAVGYASVTVASSFNDMAIGSGIHSLSGGIIAALVLFLGHTLNVMLGLMSVIVHGVRLNMLEFSGHLNMQWAGKVYKPFKE